MLRQVGEGRLRRVGGAPRRRAARRTDRRRRGGALLQLAGAVLLLEAQALEQRLLHRGRTFGEGAPARRRLVAKRRPPHSIARFVNRWFVFFYSSS